MSSQMFRRFRLKTRLHVALEAARRNLSGGHAKKAPVVLACTGAREGGIQTSS
jgi:hypothetical protein